MAGATTQAARDDQPNARFGRHTKRMASRDSLYGDPIVWEGGPKTVTVPVHFKVIAVVSTVVSIVALAFAVVVATGLKQPVNSLLLFSAWCAAIAVGAWRV